MGGVSTSTPAQSGRFRCRAGELLDLWVQFDELGFVLVENLGLNPGDQRSYNFVEPGRGPAFHEDEGELHFLGGRSIVRPTGVLEDFHGPWLVSRRVTFIFVDHLTCLLYTSDAADDLTRVDLGG